MPICRTPLALVTWRRNGPRNALLAYVWWVQGRRVCCTVQDLSGIGKTRRPRPWRSFSIGLGRRRHSINPLHSARRGASQMRSTLMGLALCRPTVLRIFAGLDRDIQGIGDLVAARDSSGIAKMATSRFSHYRLPDINESRRHSQLCRPRRKIRMLVSLHTGWLAVEEIADIFSGGRPSFDYFSVRRRLHVDAQ